MCWCIGYSRCTLFGWFVVGFCTWIAVDFTGLVDVACLVWVCLVLFCCFCFKVDGATIWLWSFRFCLLVALWACSYLLLVFCGLDVSEGFEFEFLLFNICCCVCVCCLTCGFVYVLIVVCYICWAFLMRGVGVC